jgi:glutathione synthase/RimK-type ligase-like ATP-grasp enzyme
MPSTPRILILTQINDVHAAAVMLALDRRGAGASVILCGDFPTRLSGSIFIPGPGQARDGAVLCEGDRDIVNSDADVVWYRRPTRPRLPDDMHPGDRQIAIDECEAFERDLYDVLAPSAFWINTPSGARQANRKISQLKHASAAGFRVPATLASNDPKEIRCFLERHRGSAIHKTFLPNIWEDGDNVTLAFTSKVGLQDLPRDDILRLAPGIYQELIPKSYELRLTLFGATCMGAKLRSSEHADAAVDWRAAGVQVPVEPYEVPLALQRQCFALMAQLGIVSGCADLIVTPDGEPVFLEINQAGQWLWLEECCPELTLLDAFVDFLHEGPAFAYRPRSERLRYKDFRAAALALLETQLRSHVQHSTWSTAADSSPSQHPTPS